MAKAKKTPTIAVVQDATLAKIQKHAVAVEKQHTRVAKAYSKARDSLDNTFARALKVLIKDLKKRVQSVNPKLDVLLDEKQSAEALASDIQMDMKDFAQSYCSDPVNIQENILQTGFCVIEDTEVLQEFIAEANVPKRKRKASK